MIEALGSALIAFLEREIIKHQPELQQYIIDELGKLSTILSDYIVSKCSEDIEKLEHNKEEQLLESDK